MNPFIQGILAGYGIAIPVGAIAILIVDTAIRRGFRSGFAAGAGAATADIVYASLAALAGQALAALLAPFSVQIRILSALALVFLGGWGIWQIVSSRKNSQDRPAAIFNIGLQQTYLKFVSLTLLNPLTVTYFAALILAENNNMPDWPSRILFVAGAGLASLSWQGLLAGLGALAHKRLSPRFQLFTSLAGNLIVAGLGVRIFFQ